MLGGGPPREYPLSGSEAQSTPLAGVRVINWSLKEPPVAIETCAVVVDPALFARTTLEQLGLALANPKRWMGWTVSQLIERLAQVGVSVALEDEFRRGSER